MGQGREKALKIAGNTLKILAGTAIYALAIAAFLLPSGMITGGTTGLALIARHFWGVPIELFVWAFNAVMFLFGGAALGWKFAFTTLLSSIFYPLILGILQRVPALSGFGSDPMLAAVFGGLMIGAGIGMVIRAGASSGGMDIPPLVLHKKFGIPVAAGLYFFDLLILLLQMTFSNKEQILYGLLLALVYTAVLDKVLLRGSSRTQAQIVSKKYEEILQMVLERLDRGATLLHAQTGYRREETMVVLTAVSNRELPRLTAWVTQIDPEAFLIVSRVNEVHGRGFTLQRNVIIKETS